MAQLPPEQLGPEDKISFGQPFSYAKAIVKDNITYPIVPNCPIINADESGEFGYWNIPAGTFFIAHVVEGDIWYEVLCLRVPDTTVYSGGRLERGYIVLAQRNNGKKK